MPAYCFFDVLKITDEDKLEEYRAQVFATVEKYKGRYVVLGGQYQCIEGDWSPVFPVLIEFPTLTLAKQWYNSDEYRPVRELRLAGTRTNAVIFEGLE